MRITIIGAARSGVAAALLAKELGYTTFLSESKSKEDFKETIALLEKAGIESEFGGNSKRAIENTDLIVTSPGVPPSSKVLFNAENKGIKIISELEFGWIHLKNPTIAITGTNGKTTTTALTAHIFNHSGRKAIACGNIGKPISSLVGKISPDTVIVAEVSSFQLDRIDTFKPDVAMILNITPDHISYHGSYENYIAAKYNIYKNQKDNDLLIINADDETLNNNKPITQGGIAAFSQNAISKGIYVKDGNLMIRFPNMHKEENLMETSELSLPGLHNCYNSMAAALSARVFEIRNEDIRDSLMSFLGVEHRLEYVRTVNSVDYINDSKATNVNATWYALSSYNSPLVWIAGGRGDNNDYSLLDDLVEKNVKCIIAIGEEKDSIFNHFSAKVRCVKIDDLIDAVNESQLHAEPGDIVLFTPACKSFDQFMNYEHRGEVFKAAVNDL
jgi:UDP-N-acetylmuramoylalanine--D-glutamate ligase